MLRQALTGGNLTARVQALNVLETMKQDALEALPSVKALIVKSARDQDYDSRPAEWLVSKLENR